MNWKQKPGGIKSDVNKQIITSQNFIVLENQIQTFWDIREKRHSRKKKLIFSQEVLKSLGTIAWIQGDGACSHQK